MSNEKAITVPKKTRPMNKADYATIYTLLENGTPREAILAGYPIKLHTLNLRIAADRPDLWEKLKAMPTSKHVEVDATARAEAIIKATGRILRVDIAEIVGHDVGVLADKARKQKAEKLKDPNKVLTTVGLKDARNLLALAKVASVVPGMGLESGGGGVTINNNPTVNHATIMRRGDGDGILADETDFIDAVVIEPGEDK